MCKTKKSLTALKLFIIHMGTAHVIPLQLETREELLSLLNHIRTNELKITKGYLRQKQISYYCNVNKRSPKTYYNFSIPKKSGGIRSISSPCPALMIIQRCINELLKSLYEPSEAAMGFVPGRSIADNASHHVGMKYVFNIDLSDFFTSIHQARVWKVLQLAPFYFSKEIASIIAGLCCENDSNGRGVLPQGAPSSPILTNIICRNLDRRLLGLARRFNLKYTRYADDITFSSMHNVYQEDSEFRAELKRIITAQNFKINEKKTRLQTNGERQSVTGLVVNSKVNVSREYIRDLRSLLYIWEKYGYEDAYSCFIKKYRYEKPQTPRNMDMLSVIDGRLQFLKQVKGSSDVVYKKLYQRFRKLASKEKFVKTKHNIHYIVWYTLEDFEKIFNTTVHFQYKKQYGKRTGSSRTTALCNLLGQETRIHISELTDRGIELYLQENDETIREWLSSYYITLAERDGKTFWLMMGKKPFNNHIKGYTSFSPKYRDYIGLCPSEYPTDFPSESAQDLYSLNDISLEEFNQELDKVLDVMGNKTFERIEFTRNIFGSDFE